jgi:YD repeat-containing protein
MRPQLFIRATALALAFASLTPTARGQYTPELPQVIPQTPQAAAFERYGEYPISPATGVPRIEIPLYTIECGDIKVPITISYHASGIKVEDVATPVGLGWTLNWGGSIVRQKFASEDNGSFWIRSKAHAEEQMEETGDNIDTTWKAWLLPDSPYDHQSDRYIYSINGKSGVFRFNTETEEIVTIPYAPIQVSYTLDDESHPFRCIDKITIKDTDGLIYYFEGKERTRVDMNVYISAWYITRIESLLTGDSVVFNYRNGETYTQYNYAVTVGEGIGYEPEPKFGNEHGDRWILGPGDIFYYNVATTPIHNTPLLLDNIHWKGNQIKFQYAGDRLDKYKERLKNITVLDSRNNVKDIVFDTSYFGDNENNYRMRLDSLTIGKMGIPNGKKYKFGYDPDTLPAYNSLQSDGVYRHSRSDYWGYYNGKESLSGKFIPQEYADYGYGTDKNPIQHYMTNSILTQIQYPTGGTTSFDYEANRIEAGYDYKLWTTEELVVGGLRVKSVISKTADGQETRKAYEYSGYSNQMIEKAMFHYPQHRIYAVGDAGMLPWFERKTNPGSRNIDNSIWQMIPSNPLYSLTGFSHSPVFYHTVTEYHGSISQNTGKRVYTYRDNLDYAVALKDSVVGFFSPVMIDFPFLMEDEDYDIPRFFHPYNDYDPGLPKPLLVKEEDYVNNGSGYSLRKRLENRFIGINKGRFIIGVKIGFRSETICFKSYRHDNFHPYLSANHFYEREMYRYDMLGIRHFYLPSRTVTTEYTPNGDFVTTESHEYDPLHRTLSPVRTTVSKSDGTGYTETYERAFDLADGSTLYAEMTDKNIVDPVIRRTRTDNGNTLSIEYPYKEENGLFLPAYARTAKNGLVETRIIYHAHDPYGNPVHVTKDDGVRLAYLWSYGGQYPVAEIQLGTHILAEVEAAVSSLFSVTGIDALSRQAAPNEYRLRDGSLRAALPHALVTTYTYAPLVGVTSVTAPDGTTTYYEYDALGRLARSFIKDGTREETIERYEYNYANP